MAAQPQTEIKSPWLHAWHDPLSNLRTITPCVRLGDLNGDGDSKLCVCDLDKKLKVFRSTSMIAEEKILDNPTSMCIIYSDNSLPRIPSIAVAAGSHVFIYRQLRPYKKWSCPALTLSSAETDVWNDLVAGSVTIVEAVKLLTETRDGGTMLSSRSVDLLAIASDSERQKYVEMTKDATFVQQTLVTCMETLKKDSEDNDAVCLLVVGTEAGQVYILPPDPSNSVSVCSITLPSAPVILTISGLYDVDWRICVTCRDGKVYNIKNGDVRGTAILSGTISDLGSHPVAVARQDRVLWIATMDRNIACYSTRGKRTKTILVPDDVVDLCSMVMKRQKVSHLLVAALANGEVRVYRETALVSNFQVEKPISAVRFGPYGREEFSLIVVHGRGAITVKMWRRNADVENINLSSGPPPEQDIPLPVPKKTKLYVEQTQREREQAPAIHRAFQRDLCKMRLETARAYVKTLTDGQMGASPLGAADVRVHVQVQGLGPNFLLKISLQNAGIQPIANARLVLTYDTELYIMGHTPTSQNCVAVPVLLPGPKYTVEAEVKSIDPQGRSGQVLLLLYNPQSKSSFPMLSATIRMPASELFA